MTRMIERLAGEDMVIQVNCSPDLPTVRADSMAGRFLARGNPRTKLRAGDTARLAALVAHLVGAENAGWAVSGSTSGAGRVSQVSMRPARTRVDCTGPTAWPATPAPTPARPTTCRRG